MVRQCEAIFNNISLPFSFHDLTHLSKMEKKHSFENFLNASYLNPIDLTHAPLIKFTVFCLVLKNSMWFGHVIIF